MPASTLRRPQKGRKHLSADPLYELLHGSFERVPDPRRESSPIRLSDALMSGLALFALKDPSLLAFDSRRHDENMKCLFHIDRVPCDTQMRKILDDVDPLDLRPAFRDVFREAQRGKVLQRLRFLGGSHLLLMDGTQYFVSEAIHCESCLRKEHQDGRVTYSHQMLSAVLAHPDHREVIPLAPEPIGNGDGKSKNDCERNAAGRLLRRIRAEHPHLKLIVVEDGLASNAPHIRDIIALRMHFILGAKPGDHEFLYNRLMDEFDRDQVTVITWKEATKTGTKTCEIHFVNGLPLNASNQDLLVNFLGYAEYDADGNVIKRFGWVTDLKITRRNCRDLVRGGRARWKIENETYNTLKNQGYHFEHNFGHGERNLAVVFAMLMMLAFLVNQMEQLCCPLFRAVWTKLGSKRAVWEKVRSHFEHFRCDSMRRIYEAILYDLTKNLPLPGVDSS
ncbi:MAG: transposase [Terriglobia bacterium]